MMPRLYSSATLAAGVMIASLVVAAAQTPAATTTPAATNSAAATSMTARVDAHIATLRSELKITTAQQPQWHELTIVMRRNATHMDALYRQRTRNADRMNAVQILQSYRDFTRTHLRALDHLIPAFSGLYHVLSPAQKKTADELFENRVAASTNGAPGAAPNATKGSQ